MNRFEFYSNVEKFKNNQSSDELSHYGIIGQKWGTRRWQYVDGRFNPEGKERYFGSKSKSENIKNEKQLKKNNEFAKEYIDRKNMKNGHKMFNKMLKNDPDFKKLSDKYFEDMEKWINEDYEKGISRTEYAKRYYDDVQKLAKEKYGLTDDKDSNEFAFWSQGLIEENVHDKYGDIYQLAFDKTMKNKGWEEKEVKPYEHSSHTEKQFSKDIDNDEYDGKKFVINKDDGKEIGAKKVNEDANKALNFLNKKGSYQKILDEIADNQYDIYKEVMIKEGKKPLSKSEFIKNEGLTIKEIGLETYDHYNTGNISIVFRPGENTEWFGNNFQVWIDPNTGKYIEMYQS